MRDFLEKFKKFGADVKLSESGKREIRSRLVLFMGSAPVRGEADIRHLHQRSLITWFKLNKPMSIFAAIVLAVLLGGGGTSLAAQAALPGDVLYPVKVNINEEVRGVFALSAEAKAEWQAERTRFRIEEAEKLAAEGKLSEEVKARIVANFEAQAERMKARIEYLQDKQNVRAAEVAARAESALEAHIRLLDNVGANGEIKQKLQAEIEAVKKLRMDSESKLEAEGEAVAKPAAEGKIEAARNVIEAPRRYLDREEDDYTAETVAAAEARLKIAEDLVAQAEAKIQAGAYGEAFALGNDALRAAHEVKITLHAGAELRLPLKMNLRFSGEGNATSSTSTLPGLNGRGRLNLDLNLNAGDD